MCFPCVKKEKQKEKKLQAKEDRDERVFWNKREEEVVGFVGKLQKA